MGCGASKLVNLNEGGKQVPPSKFRFIFQQKFEDIRRLTSLNAPSKKNGAFYKNELLPPIHEDELGSSSSQYYSTSTSLDDHYYNAHLQPIEEDDENRSVEIVSESSSREQNKQWKEIKKEKEKENEEKTNNEKETKGSKGNEKGGGGKDGEEKGDEDGYEDEGEGREDAIEMSLGSPSFRVFCSDSSFEEKSNNKQVEVDQHDDKTSDNIFDKHWCRASLESTDSSQVSLMKKPTPSKKGKKLRLRKSIMIVSKGTLLLPRRHSHTNNVQPLQKVAAA